MPPRQSFLTHSSRDEKIPLPVFLKVLSSTGLAMDKAMAITSKIYKNFNTPATLGQVTDGTLVALHVDDKEQRKFVLSALKKAGYRSDTHDPVSVAAASAPTLAKASSSEPAKKSSPKKRKRGGGYDELLPDGPRDEAADYGSFVFEELLDEEALKTKSTVVNRAPVMTAWAMVVAERMGFKREEALSIASVYTELNATSKGVKLGIFEEGKGKGMEAAQEGSQPYVDFMGRRPVLYTQTSQWRALLKGELVTPSSAYRYITSAFRQTTGHIVGAMRLLAATYSHQELNRLAFSLYAEFRPQTDGWGKKAELRCENILNLKRVEPVVAEQPVVKIVKPDEEQIQESESKRLKAGMSLEEYEAALDEDDYEGFFTKPTI
ncbi:hypothetical protein BU17DRAFT_73363 [Hysterangium stoloniferum]|nr:hypothetical protein BU17DRAFT_73363 [Hysterangium stoloniferum]